MTPKKRWLYIKNGDVVEQLNLLGDCPQTVPEGGTEAFIGDLLRYACGQDILLLSCSDRNVQIRKGNVTAKVLRTELKNGKFRFVKFFLLVFQFMNGLIKAITFRPHFIICGRSGSMLWLTHLVAGILNVPWIHSRHNRVSNPGAQVHTRLTEKIDGYCIRRANATICHGPYLKQQLLDIGVQRHRIYEFDIGFSDLISQINSLNNSEIQVALPPVYALYVGRMEDYKGIFDILTACRERLHRGSDFGLVYAGDGGGLLRLQEEIAENGLAGKVSILGKVPRNQLLPVIKTAKVLIVASKSTFPEGRCMAAMEGLALGIPVVAPNFGPFPYLIKSGKNGLLFEPDSAEDLKAKLDLLLDKESIYQEISQGVEAMRSNLIHPARTFSQAIHQAFKTTCIPQ
nr:glycosyltransferase family 4 protein [Desulfobulbaceae bacterium]